MRIVLVLYSLAYSAVLLQPCVSYRACTAMQTVQGLYRTFKAVRILQGLQTLCIVQRVYSPA